jgi:hypothetical protein
VKSTSAIAGFALACVLSFLVLMTIVQGIELKRIERKLTRSEDLLAATQVELGRIKGVPILEGLSPLYALDPRGPDNISRLRYDLGQLERDFRKMVPRVPKYDPRSGGFLSR